MNSFFFFFVIIKSLLGLEMNRNKSVRVTPISKLTKNEYEHEQQIPNTKIVYSTAKQGYIDTVQTHNQKDRVLRSKDFLCQSAPSFNFVQHSVKLTSKLVKHTYLFYIYKMLIVEIDEKRQIRTKN